MPEQFSQSIGRIVYGAGQVEFLIGRMLPGGATGESWLRRFRPTPLVGEF